VIPLTISIERGKYRYNVETNCYNVDNLGKIWEI
jgi:hypothetical protein